MWRSSHMRIALTCLNLNNGGIGTGGAVRLSVALVTNSTLTSVDLSHNMIDDAGARRLRMALYTNTTLTSLDMSGNIIEDVYHLSSSWHAAATVASHSF